VVVKRLKCFQKVIPAAAGIQINGKIQIFYELINLEYHTADYTVAAGESGHV
jgi:hypothetical protein